MIAKRAIITPSGHARSCTRPVEKGNDKMKTYLKEILETFNLRYNL